MTSAGRAETVVDRLGRPVGSLRISVTDRCNMRCQYCMPEAEYAWLPRSSLLTFEEIDRLAGRFREAGVHQIRLTGGEPLLRRDLAGLVGRLAQRVDDLSLTTNGLLLAPRAALLHAAGLGRVTVSLDTLRPERMLAHAGTDHHGDVIAGIRAARRAGLPVKLNAVVLRGFNDDEMVPLLQFAQEEGAELRFIEYMDVGGATRWDRALVVSREEIMRRVGAALGAVESLPVPGSRAPAERFRAGDGTLFGIVASTTQPFCRTCDRGRLTADGTWYLCLYAREGIDLREPLRAGSGDDELLAIIREGWARRTDRGAEDRLRDSARSALYAVEGLRRDPHLEMHTRGG